MAVKVNHLEVYVPDLVEVCGLAGKEIDRRMEAAKEEGDAKAFIACRAQSDRLKRLLTAAVRRVEGAVQVPGVDSTDD